MCQKWKDELVGSPYGAVIHVNKWLARATLDVIGEGVSEFALMYAPEVYFAYSRFRLQVRSAGQRPKRG